MHKRRLATIARWLEAGAPEKKGVTKFDMNLGVVFNKRRESIQKIHACGSTCCIAGAAVQFFNNPIAMMERFNRVVESELMLPFWSGVKPEAMSLLGLDETIATRLFEPEVLNGEWSGISPAWAARCIRKLIKTGEVDWKGTENEVQG